MCVVPSRSQPMHGMMFTKRQAMFASSEHLSTGNLAPDEASRQPAHEARGGPVRLHSQPDLTTASACPADGFAFHLAQIEKFALWRTVDGALNKSEK